MAKKQRVGGGAPSSSAWGCVLLTTLSALLMGYDVGIMSSAILFIKTELKLSTIREEMVVGSLNLVAAGGAAIAGLVSNRLGRRRTLAAAAAVFLVGAIALAAAPGFSVLMLGRVLTGIGVGFAMMIAPLYSAEISPARLRGFLVSFTEIFIDVGILLGYLVGFALQFLDPAINWRLMLGAGAIPAVVLLVGAVWVLPESPRWLVMRGRHEEAMAVLERIEGDGELLGSGSSASSEEGSRCRKMKRVQEMVEANEAEAAAAGGESSSWRPLCRMYAVAVGINFFQQAAGIEATVYYSPTVFRAAGVRTRLGMLGATLGVGFVKLLFVLVATFTLDRLGRRKLLLLSSAGMAACLAVIVAAFAALHMSARQLSPPAAAAGHGGSVVVVVVAVCCYVASFSMGWGPVAYVVSSEIFPPRHRSRALGLSMLVNRLVSGSVALTFLTVSHSLTPAGTFGIFAGFTLLSIVFVLGLVPETKGKTLEELAWSATSSSADLVASVGNRRSSSCVLGPADLETPLSRSNDTEE